MTHFISKLTSALGSIAAIVLSIGLILVWLISGPLFRYSDTWQLVINTTTTIITFMMVFIIQNTQNREGRAVQTKLDAILDQLLEHSQQLVGLEELPEKQIVREQERVRQDAT